MTTTTGFTATTGLITTPAGGGSFTRHSYPFMEYAARNGVVDERGMTIDDALDRGGLNFTVQSQPAQSAPDEHGDVYDFPDHRCLLRVNPDGSKSWLSVMSSTYPVVDYRQAFEFGQSLIDDFDANVVALAPTGTPVGVAGIMVLRLNRAILLNDTDVVEMFAMVRNSHDGTSTITAEIVPVHQRTGATITTGTGRAQSWRIRHSGDVTRKFEVAVNTMRKVEEWAIEFKTMTSRLLAASMTTDEFTTFAAAMLPTPPAASSRSAADWAKRRALLVNLFVGQPADAFGKGTCYAAYAAWIEYCDFYAPARGDAQHRRNTRMVTGASHKDKAAGWRWITNHAA